MFQLNVFKPMMIHNFLHSVDLLTAARSERLAQGLVAVEEKHPVVFGKLAHAGGPYQQPSATTKREVPKTPKNGTTSQASALELDTSNEEFDLWMRPEETGHV